MSKSIEQTYNEMMAAFRELSDLVGSAAAFKFEGAVHKHIIGLCRERSMLSADVISMRNERDALQERCAAVDKAYRLSQETIKAAGDVIRSQSACIGNLMSEQDVEIEALRAENAAMANELEHLRAIRKCHKAAQYAFSVMDEALHGSVAEAAEKALTGRESE